MRLTRRSLVQGGAATLTGVMLTSPLAAVARRAAAKPLPDAHDGRLRELISKAIDAATQAGATYADARLTFTQKFDTQRLLRDEALGFGVRALVDGYWGFSASSVWSVDEAARIGRTATMRARVNVLGHPRDMTLAPHSSLTSGDWIMPVKDDPFTMALDEILDYHNALKAYIKQKPGVYIEHVGFSFVRQQKAFGSSLGQFVTQRLYRTGGRIGMGIQDGMTQARTQGFIDPVTFAGLGFEYIRDQPIRRYVDELYADLLAELKLPIALIDVGKYAILVDARGIASVLSQGVGLATEIDRAMGFEANAGGTSYINEPETMVGSLKIGAPTLQINAGRSTPGSAGHVKWDDEGVEPRDFTIIRNGVLADMQSNREGVSWLTQPYARTNQPLVSHGCAYAPDAIDAPLVHSADLAVQLDTTNSATLETLRSELPKGIEFQAPDVSFDFQQITALLFGKAFELRQGKRVARLADAGVLFRTPELLGNIQSLGGATAVRQIGLEMSKGEPSRDAYHSVSTPPMVFKDMTVVDIRRKA